MATSRNLSTYREALRQLNGGIDGNELCVPCKNAVFDDDFARIGTSAWMNDGFPDCEHLDKPALYCCFCRHIIRAKEAARRSRGTETVPNVTLDWVLTGMEQGIFIHDEGVDLDEDDASVLDDFEVKKCSYVRSIRGREIDVKRIKTWLRDCEKRHGEACNPLVHAAEVDSGKILLVDVEDDCLVEESFNQRYFALSYVWGGAKQFLTLVENFESLRNLGGMSAQPITQTIKDAMQFVRSLGERYLWVDTVCIIQDDYANKAQNIRQMASIYSKAVATIIAMGGNSADAGLSGISPTARNLSAVYIAPGLRLVERTPLERVMNEYNYGTEEYVYNTRAWTFQERLLSNRSIIFLREQVYFQCKSVLLSEDRYDMDYSNSAIFTLEKAKTWSQNNRNKSKKYSHLDDFKYYEELVVEYTAKRMGYPEDIINAFVGVLTELKTIFSWDFVEGLPIPCLHLALLWTPLDIVVRRPTNPLHPSWSWSGWLGRIHYKDLVRPFHLSLGDLFHPLVEFDLSTPKMMRFKAETLRADTFALRASKKRLDNPHYNSLITPDVFFIYDQDGRRCGILYGICNEVIEQHRTEHPDAPLLLISLSKWSRANSMRTYGPIVQYSSDGNTEEEELFNSHYRDAEWCTYNIMLVNGVEGAYERIAVGQMHTDAWWKHNSSRKQREIALR